MFAFGANSSLPWHFIPLIAVLLMLIANVGFNRGYLILQSRRDSRRHRAALAAELASLLDLVRENLRLVRADAGYVLSTRGSTAVYRGTIGRLTFLREEEIAAIVPAYVLVERLEALAAARTKPVGSAIYRYEAGKADLQQLRREYHKIAAAIERTLTLLSGRSNGDQPIVAAPSAISEVRPISIAA